MATLSSVRIADLLSPFGVNVDEALLARLSIYLDLLMRWNARTNLTAVREPEEIVSRHFGESLFAGMYLGDALTLLDYGSGAGFPGLPIALLRSEVAVTLAESQHKKAAFLREVVRVLGLSVEVWGGRVEAMPEGRRFDCVALRAVDQMDEAVREACARASRRLLVLTTAESGVGGTYGFRVEAGVPVPGSIGRTLVRFERDV